MSPVELLLPKGIIACMEQYPRLSPRTLGFLVLLVLVVASFDYNGIGDSFNRSSFPSEFVFGAASSSYQYEGAAREGGKGPSIWDTFAHRHPEMIFDGSNGDVAEDFYHRYKEDIQNLKKMGMDAFRFSISWPRILPNGSLSGGINKQGIKFYNDLIDELLANDLKPFVTIFHWDLPQAIEDKYAGFLSKHILRDYLDYAEVCFKEFGHRVKHWITFNEPVIFCSRGYASGIFAPGRCSPWEAGNCTVGDSGTEPYIAAHNILIAHSSIVKLYRDKYQSVQNGNIGMTLATHWFMPYSSSINDVNAASRSIDFMFGWFLGPLTYGEYPNSMRDYLGTRLPKFTKEESELLKESYDFLGINYYATFFSRNDPDNDTLNKSYDTDSRTIISGDDSNGIQLPLAYSTSSFYINPPGIRDIVVYTKNNYKNPVIYITENGVAQLSNSSLPLNEALEDDIRISYHRDHLFYLNDAIRKGVDVRGYFAWSFMDDFEWSSGYSHRFGLYYVDYNNNLKRYPKKSALWFTKFLRL